jgi:ectoine hydroxylase-related dioxygenase (phytanoyl-CoA dioxygenase family)
MKDLKKHSFEISENGFTTINNIYSKEEIESILSTIEQVDKSIETFRKSKDLFAIRQFLKEVPSSISFVFNDNLKTIVQELFGENYFIVKSIYFDKPANSNWYVSYHQDLTISVENKIEKEGFGPWTVKQNQFSVQPPSEILESIFTIRIHLDKTDENNAALKVIPKSHLKNIYRPELIDWLAETETICNVEAGGIMIMKPLLLHSSNRTTNNQKRRVIHIEFSNYELPTEMNWAEHQNIY